MKKFSSSLMFVVAVFIVGLYFLGEDSQQTTPVSPPQQPQHAQQSQHVAKEIPARAEPEKANLSWPFIQAGDESDGLADSLTQKNIIMIFDGSGSMQKSGCSGKLTKIEAAKEVVTEWSESVPEEANLGLIVFDKTGFSIRLPLGRQNRETFRTEIGKVVAEYKTPLSKSLSTAYQMLTRQAKKQLGYGDYNVVIVTDGAADDVNNLKQTVDTVLSRSPIMINTIGFCINSDHTLNTPGRTTYKAANNPDELRQGLQEVLAESKVFDISGFE